MLKIRKLSLDILTCGVLSTDLSMDTVLRSMFNLAHDSPGRREIYVTVSNVSTFAKWL